MTVYGFEFPTRNKVAVYDTTETDALLEDKADLDDVYSKDDAYSAEETDALLDGKYGYKGVGMWLRYDTSWGTASWYEDIDDWIDKTESRFILWYNPDLNLAIIRAGIVGKTYDGKTLAARLEELDVPTSGTTGLIPLVYIPEKTSRPANLWYPIAAYWMESDGTRYNDISASTCFTPDGIFCVRSFAGRFYNTTTSTHRKLYIDAARPMFFGGEFGRYSLYSASECRASFVNQIESDEGDFYYRGKDASDPSDADDESWVNPDATYMDCSGLVWRGAWFGAGLPIAANLSTLQSLTGEYVTSANIGEDLDVSKMLPGDIVAIGRPNFTYTSLVGTHWEHTVTWTDNFSVISHVAVYLGNNEFMHITSSDIGYLFPAGAQKNGVSPWDGNTVLLSENYTPATTAPDGQTRAKGPYKFRGMDKWRKNDAGPYDGRTSKGCWRVVVRIFPDREATFA